MIYLDHHATTPVDARVLEAMLPYFGERFGNPSSRNYRLGWEAGEAVERARRQVAALVGASPKDIVFTSGATEANNLALKGVAEAGRARGTHVVTVATEHRSVLDPLRRLTRQGFEVTVLPVGADGLVDVDRVRAALTPRTTLVSVMTANNEIGVVQPIAELAAAAHGVGALFHTDAVQAAGQVPFDVEALDVDLASLTAHKMYGPKGVGALYVARRLKPSVGRRVEVLPLLDGGGHERGLRSGTLNVPGIVGFGSAAEIAQAAMPEESARLRALRDCLLARLRAHIDGVRVNGALDPRLPGNLNVSFDGVDGRALLVALDDVAVSSGAACASGEPSHVLMALGLSREAALASLRFGLGRQTTLADVEAAAQRVADVVARLRAPVPA